MCVLWCRSTVQLNALPVIGPSSGSVADPWSVTAWPGIIGVPSIGSEIVGVGGVLPTVTVVCAVPLRPDVLVTVRLTA